MYISVNFCPDGLNPFVDRMTAVHWAESRVEKGVRVRFAAMACFSLFAPGV